MSAIFKMLRKAKAVLVKRGASHADAEDLVQEAFIRLDAYTKAAEVRVPEAVLIRTAVNLSVDLVRRRRQEPFVPMDAAVARVVDASPNAEESVLSQQRFNIACDALSRLKPKTRRILLAQRVYGMSYAEIAKAEGMSVDGVEKQIGRAVHFLTQWMETQ